jgi:hypothetical protein
MGRDPQASVVVLQSAHYRVGKGLAVESGVNRFLYPRDGAARARRLRTLTLAGAILVSGQTYAAEPFSPPPTVFVGTDARVQGYVGARYGGLWGLGSQLIDEKTAAAILPLNSVTLQIEGRGAGFFLSGAPSARAMGAGHFYWHTSGGAAGGFGGFEVAPGGGVAFVGLEARVHRGWLVPYAQVAGGLAVGGGSNAGWVRAGVQAFPTPNLMLQGDVRYLSWNTSSWLFSGNAEFRLPGRAWSGHATLNHQTGVGSGGGGATSFLAGIRIHLGNGSLYEAYTSGAGWNLLPLMF